jgi:hypothetical protein
VVRSRPDADQLSAVYPLQQEWVHGLIVSVLEDRVDFDEARREVERFSVT